MEEARDEVVDVALDGRDIMEGWRLGGADEEGGRGGVEGRLRSAGSATNPCSG